MIKVYFPGDHPGKFVGIRVAVSVNAKLKQKYFSFNHHDIMTAMQHATALEQTWLADQADYQRERVFSRGSNTGISGLQLTYYVQTKPYGTYVYRRLALQLSLHNQRQHRSWHISSDVLPQELWEEACKLVHEFKQSSPASLQQMIDSKPTAAQVRKVYEAIPQLQ